MYLVKTNTSFQATTNNKREARMDAQAVMCKVDINHSVVVDTATGEVVYEFVKERPAASKNYVVRQVWG